MMQSAGRTAGPLHLKSESGHPFDPPLGVRWPEHLGDQGDPLPGGAPMMHLGRAGIYGYVTRAVPMPMKMFEKRLRGYGASGEAFRRWARGSWAHGRRTD